MCKAAEHAFQKINWAYLTIAAVAHNLRHDTPLELRHTRSSPLILFRLWQSCVLPLPPRTLNTKHKSKKSKAPCSDPSNVHLDATQSMTSSCKNLAFPPEIAASQATRLYALSILRHSYTPPCCPPIPPKTSSNVCPLAPPKFY
jgi:hypothetical protein